MRRLVSFDRVGGRQGFGLLEEGVVVDLSQDGRWPDLGSYLAQASPGSRPPWEGPPLRGSQARSAVGDASPRPPEGGLDGPRWPLREVHLRAPIPAPPKIVAVGLNYREHAQEQDKEPPAAPMFFAKARTAVIGPGEAILLPPGHDRIDVEVELVVVIGRGGRDLVPSQALEHVLGFTVGNDVSDRQAQKDDKQFYRAKSFDTFAPIGPWVVLREDFNHHRGAVRLWRSGFAQQNGDLSQLVFKVETLVSLLSRVHRLEPGDLLFTGTPSGVGAHRTPPVFLQSGDDVVCEIEGLGRLENPVGRR